MITTVPNNRYIPGLDGMRAISILLVIIAHLGYEKFVPGGLGVTIFFFISGFLITRLIRAEMLETNDFRLDNFYFRRFLRLFPALFVYVMLMLAFVTVTDMAHITSGQLSAALFYYVNYHGIVYTRDNVVPWGQLWSLAVEEHFYIVFPLILIALKRRPVIVQLSVTGVMIILGAAWRSAVYNYFYNSDYIYAASDTRFENIVWGCSLALFLEAFGSTKTNLYRDHLVYKIQFLAALLILFVTLTFREETFRNTMRYTLQSQALFMLFISLYFDKTLSKIIAALEWQPFRFVGKLSYSLYLWHWPLVWFCHRTHTPITIPGACAILVSSFGLAWMSYRYVETPIMAMRKKLSHA